MLPGQPRCREKISYCFSRVRVRLWEESRDSGVVSTGVASSKMENQKYADPACGFQTHVYCRGGSGVERGHASPNGWVHKYRRRFNCPAPQGSQTSSRNTEKIRMKKGGAIANRTRVGRGKGSVPVRWYGGLVAKGRLLSVLGGKTIHCEGGVRRAKSCPARQAWGGRIMGLDIRTS